MHKWRHIPFDMTSSIIASLSILNIWRRGRLTALDDDVVDDDGDDDDDDDNSDDGSDVDLGVRFFTKIQDQIKNPDHQDFSLRKETIIVKCLEGFSWREEKRKKKPKKKLPKCLVLSKSALIQTLHTHFQPWLSNTELLIIWHV